ncbi:MAG: HNH endonuclease [Bacteroidetes bacterium]|nr:HNH endonuclease [Bacteroidota bacterium]
MAANDKEIWKPVTHIKGKTSKKYAVSSKGRLASYDKNIEDRYVLKQHLNGGFPMATIHVEGKSKALFSHQAIGAAFLKKHSPKCKFVIHLDHNKANNDISNLKWATKDEQVEHSKKSPYVLQAAARKVYTGATARKLDEKKVIALKKEIWNPKRKASLKQIAAKYGIAEMNLYRIKNGELWFHVHIEGEPIFPKYKTQLKNIEFHEKVAAKVKKAAPKKVVKKAAPKKAVKKAAPKKAVKKTTPKKAIAKKPVVVVTAKKVKAKKEKKGKKDKKGKKKNKK